MPKTDKDIRRMQAKRDARISKKYGKLEKQNARAQQKTCPLGLFHIMRSNKPSIKEDCATYAGNSIIIVET